MTDDQIRAEIARLQQMLQQIEGGDSSGSRSWGKDPAENTQFFDYLKSKEQEFINKGKLEYFRIQDGKLVFDPNLAANETEYQAWLAHKKEQEKQLKAAELRKKEKLRKEMQISQISEQLRQNQRRQAAATVALKPESYNQPTPSPQPTPSSQPTQTGSGMIPPAWG